MPYFFLEDCELAPGREVSLAPADVNHAWRVLRMRKGDAVTVADGKGGACHGTIVSISSGEARVLLEEAAPTAVPSLDLILLQALAKGDKMELAMRQAVELGVKRIIPVITERSIPRWNRERETQRIRRWQAIARSAAAQCRRALIPAVEAVCDLHGLLAMAEGGAMIVLWEEEKDLSLSAVVQRPHSGKGAVSVLIGPEGGFTATEIEALHRAGAITVHMGPRILRLETAAVAALSLVQAGWGDLGGRRE